MTAKDKLKSRTILLRTTFLRDHTKMFHQRMRPHIIKSIIYIYVIVRNEIILITMRYILVRCSLEREH
jgi:hypothetical protein